MGTVTSKRRESKIDTQREENETIDISLCKRDDLKDGEMKEFEVGKGKIILVRENGIYSALGSKCTHYGAPLIKGVLKNGVIRCPWHGACFNARSGDIEDFPGLDSLPCHQVIVDDDEVRIKTTESALKDTKRKIAACRHSSMTLKTFVIVGGGGAAQSCLETLRQNNYTGKLIVISKEKHFPYDRPKLSKALDAKAESLYFRDQNYYSSIDITFMHSTEVTSIDVKQNWVICDGGKLMIKYDSLMIATGGGPVMMNAPGNELKNICLLRTPEDANFIAENAPEKAVVVIGSSFIALEITSFLLTKARSINVLCRSSVPFKNIFGEAIGSRIKRMYEEKGVIFHSSSQVKQFLGNKGYITGIELNSGEIIEADICVLGIGVKPQTDFLKDSGIIMNERGLVLVNEKLETYIPSVFACGDIVEFPLTVFNNKVANICHWQMAMAHGRTAAFNMLGMDHKLASVPFFWCTLCGKSFRFSGYNDSNSSIVIKGSIEDLEFAAYYCNEDNVVTAICTVNYDPAAAAFASAVLSGEHLLRSEIEKD